ncbi:hypothetical protein [Thomasclavelia cocleata]|uniref:hypothetical protein n=1 Tax=Thomasclavelia cocleata TaxID=69824 RepID=UPI00272BFAD7|nr:hypothetical protein [Thomasclavelia cocleata]
MSIEIDKLSIEIESNSSNASKEIDKLAGSLGNLKNNLNGAGSLRSFSTALKNLADVSGGNNLAQLGSIGDKVKRMASGFKELNGFKTGATGLLKQLSDMKMISESVGNVDFNKFTNDIKQLTSAMQPLQELGKTNLGSFFNQLKKLPEMQRALNNVDFNKFTSQMKQLASAIKPLNGVSIKLGKAFSNLPWHIKKATTQMESYSRSASKASKTSGSLMSRLGKSVASFKTVTFVVQGLTSAVTSVFEESSQYVENLNLFNVAMGETTQSALDFANKVQGAMGIDTSEWMSFQGRLNNLITGFGVASDKAQIMSQNLTQLAYDYSSLMNVDPSESFDKINSAMSGQIKGLKDYGNNVSVAMVKQTGLRYGLDGAVSDWDQNTQAIMRYITIMDNASKVDVFNDMARTIATPANAVRILTQQFTMLKRAVGNIASVFISKLIPYVQIAVQWLTSLANTIANFFGFELPKIDYSGINGGALDDIEDSADNASDAVGGTSDKIKKLKKQLMGFDELNIISKPDDGDSGGNSNGNGGGGSIGDIELPQYDFLKGLENQTTEMMDRLSKKMAEIFKPVTESWNKYGKGVLDSIEYQWNEIGELINSIGKSFSSVWQNGTGEETISRILKIVTNLNNSIGNIAQNFREAWDNCNYGTQIVQNLWNSFNTLLECVEVITEDIEKFTKELDFTPLLKSVRGLSEAFEDITVVISNNLYGAYKNVLEPLSKWTIEKAVPSLVNSLSKAMKGLAKIFDAIRPGISVCQKLATALLKICGNAILKGLGAVATVIEVLGDVFKTLKPLISGVTPLVVAFIGAWKVKEMLSTVTAVKKLGLNFSTLKVVMGDVMRVGLKTELGYIKDMILNTNNPLSSMINFVGKLNTACAPLGSVIQNVGVKMGALSVATDGAVASSGFLGTAMSFLASNPLVAVVGALGAVSIACVALMGDSNKLTSAQEKQIKKSQELAEECKKTAEKQRELNESAKEGMVAQLGDYERIKQYAGELIALNGENANQVGNVQEKVDQLNQYCGRTVVELENGRIKLVETKEAIMENIEAMKIRAMLGAQEDAYGQALLNESQTTQQLTIATKELNSAQDNYNAKISEYMNNGQSYLGAIDTVQRSNKDLVETLENAQNAYEEAGTAMALNKEELTEWAALEVQSKYAMDQSSVSAQELAQSFVDLSLEYDEQIGKSGEVTYTWDGMMQKLSDYDLVIQGHGDQVEYMTDLEKSKAQEARNYVIQCMINKGIATGQTLDEMKEKLGNTYKTMTDEEKTQLELQYKDLVNNGTSVGAEMARQKQKALGILKKHHIEAGTDSYNYYMKQLEEAQKNGTSVAQQYVDNLAKEMDKDTKVEESSKKSGKKAKKNFEDQKAEFKVDTSKAEKAIEKINKNFEKAKTATVDFKLAKTGIKIAGETFKMNLYANGGFPDMGEMFVAREAGPELVGRIGKKTAVANNDQIVSAVSGGVYNAMRSAMAGMSSGGKYEIHTTVMLDGKQVGKSVFEQHNGIVRQTGKSPLLI